MTDKKEYSQDDITEGERIVLYYTFKCAFIVLFIYFYVIPEILYFLKFGMVPNSAIGRVVESGNGINEILSNLKNEIVSIINPLKNPLTRFFLVTMVVGFFWDMANKYQKKI